MPRATFIVELDIDEDGTYGTNITSDVLSATTFQGRDDFMDSAQPGNLSLTLDNHLGKYAPKSPSVITENSVGLTTLIPIRVRTTAPISTPHFTGFITNITVNPNPKNQSVDIEASDSMDLLQRIIISQRLLLNKSTGLIINRLLDAAEGELCTNPSFEKYVASKSLTPPTDYADFGAGLSSTTTVPNRVLEGSIGRAMMTENIVGESDGWEYGLTQAGIGSGDKITVAVYVKTAFGTVVLAGRVKLVDDSGEKANVPFLTASSFARVQATATFTSTNPKLRVVGFATSSITNLTTGSVHIIRSKKHIPRNINSGDNNLPYYGPVLVSAISAIDEVRDNELGGLFYIDGGGTAVFERGSARVAASTIPLGTVDENFWAIDYKENSDDRLSKVSLSYSKFEAGAPSTYIWELELPTSRLISANGTEPFSADYGFFAGTQEAPIANVDYRLNSDSAGTGIDMTGTAYGTVDWTPYGMGSKGKIRIGATATYVTQFAVRGQPIRQSSDNQISEYIPPNAPSQPSELEHEYLLNNNKALINAWAKTLGDYADSQRESLNITIRPRTASLLEQMLSRKISDRVTLINNDKLYSTGINGDYYIESIRHSIKKAGFLHETSWSLTPV